MTADTAQTRVALITGANTGIGRVTARTLALQGWHVLAACRSRERTQPLLQEVLALDPQARIEWLELELSDLASVRRCAQSFVQRGLPLHLLINNAGLAGTHGITRDGFELAFGVNHLGHFLLTQLLLDVLKASAPSRIVHVASRAHYNATGVPWETLRQRTISRTGLPEYAVSKLSNVLFSAELARRLNGSGVNSYALHPGVVASDVWRHVPWLLQALVKPFMLDTEKGARTTLHCATSTAVAQDSGLYYDNCRPKLPSRVAQDAALARRLWDTSLEWTQSQP